MKVFIVLSAVLAIAAAGAVPNNGWGGPVRPSIDLETVAAAASTGSGSANAAQSLLELVSGTVDAPAILSSSNGVLGQVAQGEDITQILVADIPSASTSTINAVDTENIAIGVDSLNAALSGGNSAQVYNNADTNSQGQAASAAEASSQNNLQTRSQK